MECKQTQNKETCPCTWPGCSRKGICCECIKHHLKNRELPGCCFNKEGEATYDRSFEHFAKMVQENKI
jgi:hypothetical protein